MTKVTTTDAKAYEMIVAQLLSSEKRVRELEHVVQVLVDKAGVEQRHAEEHFRRGAEWGAGWMAAIIGMAEAIRHGRVCFYCTEWVPMATECCGCSCDPCTTRADGKGDMVKR